ncbi:MAG: hypothetical protein GKS00_24755 [Alphaproteobacteria bacterium]|nr:hypothetical protein [Alphaproteobacteria bacterium]
MEQQAELFPESTQAVQPDPSRAEPFLWVRRLVIWEEPGKTIRDISLRRGLNVIWSPDPGAPAAELGQRAGGGHGAGKTLFCRLLRYCLGEETFANYALRRSIADTLPSGLVGAEVSISGTLWAVIRPIGTTRKHWSIKDRTLESIVEGNDPATGIEPLLEAITSSLVPSDLEQVLPGTHEWRAWLYALGWASRDQECRFDHLLDWRHADANTRSPLGSLTKEETLLVVRLFLRLISGEELEAREKRNELPDEGELEREISYSHRRTEQLGDELTKALSVTLTVPATDPLGAAALQNAAKQNLSKINREGLPAESTEQLRALQQQLDDAIGQSAVISDQLAKTKGLIELHQEQLKALRGERANLDAASIKAKLGDFCPVCRVPIDTALVEGCTLSRRPTDADQLSSEKGDNQVQIDQCSSALGTYRQQESETERIQSMLSAQQESLRTQINGIRQKDRSAREAFLQLRFAAQQLVDRSSALSTLLQKRAEFQKQLDKRGKDDLTLKSQIEKLREQHRETMTRLNEHFNYVSKGFLGAGTTANLKLSGQDRILANVQIGGLAMTSLKAVLFDLTALLMSIEGRSALPAFLVHDSPREADLGLSLYHRLFRLLREFEALGDEPPFQYIVTTTTEPPDEIRASDYLVETLDGSTVQGRLLRREFIGGLEAS